MENFGTHFWSWLATNHPTLSAYNVEGMEKARRQYEKEFCETSIEEISAPSVVRPWTCVCGAMEVGQKAWLANGQVIHVELDEDINLDSKVIMWEPDIICMNCGIKVPDTHALF